MKYFQIGILKVVVCVHEYCSSPYPTDASLFAYISFAEATSSQKQRREYKMTGGHIRNRRALKSKTTNNTSITGIFDIGEKEYI